MGGINKFELLIMLYCTFIRSQKWTLRMFMHAIDLVCSNAWLEYREKATNLGILKKNVLDILRFRTCIAEELIVSDK